MPRLNRKLVISSLEQAVEHIQSAINELKNGKPNGLEAYIPFIYLDLNRAWNARFMSNTAFREAGTEIDCYPDDVDLA